MFCRDTRFARHSAGDGLTYAVFLYDKSIGRPRNKYGVTGFACLCHAAPCCGIAILSSASLEVVFRTFKAHRLELLDDIAEFFGERTIKNFMFALPIEFQAAAVQE